MINRKLLKAKIILSGFTMKEIAKYLGISEVTLYRKINGRSEFSRYEIYEICKLLNIENPVEVFFAQNITETQN